MTSERSLQAVERIERALARIETAAGRTAPSENNGELQRLRETHQALRTHVEGAIAQIDEILASGGGG